MSGGPAISVPMPVPADALPAGLQLTARRGEDESLLAAASRVQGALTDSDRH
jgi:Asp-tRNA(Asn)/Glu-tRNA(Gln) amidotransferase A subunit family amidase